MMNEMIPKHVKAKINVNLTTNIQSADNVIIGNAGRIQSQNESDETKLDAARDDVNRYVGDCGDTSEFVEFDTHCSPDRRVCRVQFIIGKCVPSLELKANIEKQVKEALKIYNRIVKVEFVIGCIIVSFEITGVSTTSDLTAITLADRFRSGINDGSICLTDEIGNTLSIRDDSTRIEVKTPRGDTDESAVPIVSIAQSGYVVIAGEIGVLTCTTLSPEPVTSVKWYRINKEDGQESAIEVDNNKYFGGSTESPSLVINNTDRHDEGLYMCRAVNGNGEGESPPAFLRIYVDDDIPKIEGRPISGPSNDDTPGGEKGGQVFPSSETQQVSSRKPGKPYHTEVSSDSVALGWNTPASEDVIYYEIKYKAKGDMWCRTPVITDENNKRFVVGDLLHSTDYIFKVRPHYRDGEGEFSVDSDPIHTPISPALVTKNSAVKIKDGEPAIYKLSLLEKNRNATFRTRKYEIGSSNMIEEVTIILIGATGAGKSTLINGMVNYLFGVKWTDDFRFQIIDEMDEKEKEFQGESQTDWITCYRVHPTNDEVKFICNLIDTPGIEDTGDIIRDIRILIKIWNFCNIKDAEGIDTIDSVCFVVRAPLTSLADVQKSIYYTILSMFGKDNGENIAAMVTFADGKEPLGLEALREVVPVTKHFLFNNSALYAKNTSSKLHELNKMFWDMGYNNYQQLFAFLRTMATRSIQGADA